MMDKADVKEVKPHEVLQQFVGVFNDNGWLNRVIRIRHGGRKYKILCTEGEFIAYRINENQGGSQGIPGWAVCIVDCSQIIVDSDFPASNSGEPGLKDWLNCLADGDFEIL